MLEQILFVVVVLAVASLMVVDVARTRHEGSHGHAEGPVSEARRPLAAAGLGSREAFSRARTGTTMPVAAHDPGPARHPAGASPSAPIQSRRRLRDWHVRSRLALLVVIPLAAAAVIALCVAYIVNALNGPQANSNGSVMSALAAGVVIVVVVLASLFTIAVARSVLQPLYRLRLGAQELAGPRLADAVRRASQNGASQSNGNRDGAPFGLRPVDVDAFDEIGEVARAFDELRRELLRLAVGEAAHHGKLNTTFTDLSHRGQSLMERQLRLLQHLEQGEPDAERLATLFRVKRIGTRMHRYSENLLILVGHEPSGGWHQPVALAHVIRAAVSELEEYQRVSATAQPDVAVVGPAVNDVVHLLIELTENATSFSAADMQVDISGRALASGGVLLEITDRGVGMTPKELAHANWALENPPTADMNIPKWIGLLVVARLAARHGIGVRLQPADFGGLTALVWLPDELLTEQGAMVATRLGGSAGAGSRRGLHEAVPDPAYATAHREAATTRLAPSPADIRDTAPGWRPVPDAGLPSSEPWSPASARPARRAGSQAIIGSPASELPEATPLGPDTSSAADAVVVPPAGDRGGEQRLPVFNSVESRWFREGRSAPGSPGQASAAGSGWSSPADAGWRAARAVDSPASAGSTAAKLPKRQPNANLVPGTIPSPEPVMPNRSPAAARDRLAALKRGVDKGRAATRQAEGAGRDEEARPGSPDV
ncbi:MAG TPA: ATP-binding protein [Trebonia sp.]|nr:ATP-binding protein [Trebonia sp.]